MRTREFKQQKHEQICMSINPPPPPLDKLAGNSGSNMRGITVINFADRLLSTCCARSECQKNKSFKLSL